MGHNHKLSKNPRIQCKANDLIVRDDVSLEATHNHNLIILLAIVKVSNKGCHQDFKISSVTLQNDEFLEVLDKGKSSAINLLLQVSIPHSQ